MKASTVLLHDVASNYIFERLVELRQMIETVLHDVGGPLVDLRLLIGISSDGIFYGVFDDGADLLGVDSLSKWCYVS